MDGTAETVPGWRRLPWWNAFLFLATAATTVLTGAAFAGWTGSGLAGLVLAGLSYAAAILAILLAHEMGHYLLARAWGVDSTWPYFIPLPAGFGTLGALIKLRSASPSRAAMLDIGAGGPLAGAVVAIPLYAWGLAHSRVHRVGALAPSGSDSLLALLQSWMQGETLAGGAGGMVFGDSLVTAFIQWLVIGPLPPGHDVIVHPVALAAWFGLFMTTLNLIPIGQLDGGHVTYAWLGERRAMWVSRLVSTALLLAGVFVSFNWIIWWLLTRLVIGLRHPPALTEAPLGPWRTAVAVLSLLLFLLTFVPVPLRL